LPKIVAELEELKTTLKPKKKWNKWLKQEDHQNRNFNSTSWIAHGERSKMTFKPAPVNNGFTLFEYRSEDNPSLKLMQIMWSTRKECTNLEN
jgi:UDP-3-O-acyl-N-acetylglucosamine deacetylase